MKTAKYIRNIIGWSGEARLYEVHPAHQDYVDEQTPDPIGYVVVSAAVVTWGMNPGPETYIFRSDKDGHCDSRRELPGSQKGCLDHAKALRDAGYEIVP